MIRGIDYPKQGYFRDDLPLQYMVYVDTINGKLTIDMVVIDELDYVDKENKWEESENIEMNKNSFWTKKEEVMYTKMV